MQLICNLYVLQSDEHDGIWQKNQSHYGVKFTRNLARARLWATEEEAVPYLVNLRKLVPDAKLILFKTIAVEESIDGEQ